MRKVLFLAVFIALIAGCSSQTSRKSKPSETEHVHSEWETFRNKYPFHIQVVATGLVVDGVITVIISEPPPHSQLNDLIEITRATSARVQEHPIGHNGHVKDVVLKVPINDEEIFHRSLGDLHRYLFSTAYKAEIIKIPRNDEGWKPVDVGNISVSDYDLKRWLIDEEKRFVSFYTGISMTLKDILSEKRFGVFHSETHGFVIWTTPRTKKNDLSIYKNQARQWAIDSDFVIGAIASKSTVAIIGRERSTSLVEFPPLRTEEIFRLAAVESDELAQSYERQYPFAGRYNDNSDWAPIYLSSSCCGKEFMKKL